MTKYFRYFSYFLDIKCPSGRTIKSLLNLLQNRKQPQLTQSVPNLIMDLINKLYEFMIPMEDKEAEPTSLQFKIEQMHQAVMDRDREKIRNIAKDQSFIEQMEKKEDVEWLLKKSAPLHLAVSIGDVQLLFEVLAAGIPVNCVADFDVTPLHFAIMCCSSLFIMDTLFRAGANACMVCGINYLTAYQMALANGFDLIPRLLARSNCFQYWTNHLHVAALMGNVKLMKVLLLRKRLIKTVDYWDCEVAAPLHEAARRGRIDIVQMLLEAGFDVDAKARFQGIESTEVTALECAVASGQREMVGFLIDNGAKAVTFNYFTGYRSIFEFVQHREMDEMEEVLNEKLRTI